MVVRNPPSTTVAASHHGFSVTHVKIFVVHDITDGSRDGDVLMSKLQATWWLFVFNCRGRSSTGKTTTTAMVLGSPDLQDVGLQRSWFRRHPPWWRSPGGPRPLWRREVAAMEAGA
ncbi:unnamed protein product [Lactuca virosa]|uniref:Uncharacterized protein n=1 Tax=Lactuca virosa TaxID=75947 RepID=A0AAU9LTK5_9ASTR|nr:unnamed protein product [Lactuca virosa]